MTPLLPNASNAIFTPCTFKKASYAEVIGAYFLVKTFKMALTGF